MKGVFAHAEAKEAKALRTEMSMSQKSLENAISEKCYYAYRMANLNGQPEWPTWPSRLWTCLR